MTTTKSTFYLFVTALVAIPIAAPKMSHIAVMDFEPRGVSKNEAKALSDRFRSELGALNVFAIMERNQMDMILKEQGFQQSGACSDASCIVEVGQMIAVDKMISGSVGKVGRIYTIVVKMLDVQTGKIIKQVTDDCPCPIEKVLTQTMRRVAMKMAGKKVTEQASMQLQEGQASLFIKSRPPGASIYIDGVQKDGTTPTTLSKLPKGKHVVRLQKDKMTAEKKIELKAHKVTKLELKLKLQPTRCQIISDPPEAHLWINGKYRELTPKVFEEMKPGKYKMRLFKLGFKEVRKPIEIEPNSANMLEYKLFKADQSLLEEQDRLDGKLQGKLSSKKYFRFGKWGLLLGGVATGAGWLMMKNAEHAYEDEYLAETGNAELVTELHGRIDGNNQGGAGMMNLGIAMCGASLGLYAIGIIIWF